MRREGLTRDMKSEAAERFFALDFALEQPREHLFEVQLDLIDRYGTLFATFTYT